MAKPEVKPTPVDVRPPVEFVRAKRKGQGWVAEVLTVPQSVLDSGVVKAREIGDWDLWTCVESKLLAYAKPKEDGR